MIKKSTIVQYVKIQDLVSNPSCIKCGNKNVSIKQNHIVCPICGRNDYFESIFQHKNITDKPVKQNELLAKLYSQALLNQKQQEFIESSRKLKIDVPTDTVKQFAECGNKIKNLKERELVLIKAPTGSGKTYNMLITSMQLIEQGKKVCFVFSTKNEIKRAWKMLIEMGFAEADISMIIKDFADVEKVKSGELNLKNIVLTTYSYFNNRGDSQETFSIAKILVRGRTVFLDEVHVIKDMSDVHIPLTARYFINNGNDLNRAEKCPKTMKKATCESCNNLNVHSINQYQELEFYKRLPLEKFETEFEQRNDADVIYQPGFYSDGSLLNVKSKKFSSPSELKQYLEKKYKFAYENIDHLENIELRCQFPYVKDENGKITYLTREDIINDQE